MKPGWVGNKNSPLNSRFVGPSVQFMIIFQKKIYTV